jgi:hypothetical protein
MPHHQSHLWLTLNLSRALLVTACLLVNLLYLRRAVCRRRRILRSGRNGLAKLMLDRAVRIEVFRTLLQAEIWLMCCCAVIFKVPLNTGDLRFYIISYIGRLTGALLLVYMAYFEARDRYRIHKVRGKLNAEALYAELKHLEER